MEGSGDAAECGKVGEHAPIGKGQLTGGYRLRKGDRGVLHQEGLQQLTVDGCQGSSGNARGNQKHDGKEAHVSKCTTSFGEIKWRSRKCRTRLHETLARSMIAIAAASLS